MGEILLFVCTAAAAVGLLAFPADVSRCVNEGLDLCVHTLLPTLFPFMVLSGFLIRSGLVHRTSRRFEKIMFTVFHLPGTCVSPVLLGMLGGYPTGAKAAVTLYRSGLCSKRDAEHVLAFCNNCGPGFLISSVGFGVFGDNNTGLLLFATHITASLMTGILLAPSGHTSNRPTTCVANIPHAGCSSFVCSVTDSAQSFLNLCAFVLCFSAMTGLIERTALPEILTAYLPFAEEVRRSLFLGLLEMTRGIFSLSSSDTGEQLILAAALAGWGGLSVHCQVMSLLDGTDLSPALYWKGKLLHGLLAASLTAAAAYGLSALWSAGGCLLLAILRDRPKKSSGKPLKSIV